MLLKFSRQERWIPLSLEKVNLIKGRHQFLSSIYSYSSTTSVSGSVPFIAKKLNDTKNKRKLDGFPFPRFPKQWVSSKRTQTVSSMNVLHSTLVVSLTEPIIINNYISRVEFPQQNSKGLLSNNVFRILDHISVSQIQILLEPHTRDAVAFWKLE